jgi:hypothetical protein
MKDVQDIVSPKEIIPLVKLPTSLVHSDDVGLRNLALRYDVFFGLKCLYRVPMWSLALHAISNQVTRYEKRTFVKLIALPQTVCLNRNKRAMVKHNYQLTSRAFKSESCVSISVTDIYQTTILVGLAA